MPYPGFFASSVSESAVLGMEQEQNGWRHKTENRVGWKKPPRGRPPKECYWVPTHGLWRLKPGINDPVDTDLPFGNTLHHRNKYTLLFYSVTIGYRGKDISYPGQWELMKSAVTEIAVKFGCGCEEGGKMKHLHFQSILAMYADKDFKLVNKKLTAFLKERLYMDGDGAMICIKLVKNTAQDRKYLLG